MKAGVRKLPPGPELKYVPADDLLSWLDTQFERYGDIYRASIYGSDVYVISAPRYVEHVLLRNWRNYLRRGQAVKRIALSLGNGLISSNGEFWSSQRRMIQPAFTRQAVAPLCGMMARVSGSLLEEWMRAAERSVAINVTRDVGLIVLEVTLRALFGADYDEVSPHFRIVADGHRDLRFAQSLGSLGQLIVGIAERRRRSGAAAGDILGMLMLARDREHGRPMPDAQLAREILTLVVAGHETTASILSWIWHLLSRHADVESKLSRELDCRPSGPFEPVQLARYAYTRRVIEEALRLYPPLWLMTRKATAADEIDGFFVAPGTEIYISPYIVQRHPGIWELPCRFDPDRHERSDPGERHRLALCPFGAGPRNCVGEHFALVEMQIHVMIIASRLRLLAVDNDPPEIVAGVNLLSKRDFILKPQIRGRLEPHIFRA